MSATSGGYSTNLKNKESPAGAEPNSPLCLKLVQKEHAKTDGDEGDAGSVYQVENT